MDAIKELYGYDFAEVNDKLKKAQKDKEKAEKDKEKAEKEIIKLKNENEMYRKQLAALS